MIQISSLDPMLGFQQICFLFHQKCHCFYTAPSSSPHLNALLCSSWFLFCYWPRPCPLLCSLTPWAEDLWFHYIWDHLNQWKGRRYVFFWTELGRATLLPSPRHLSEYSGQTHTHQVCCHLALPRSLFWKTEVAGCLHPLTGQSLITTFCLSQGGFTAGDSSSTERSTSWRQAKNLFPVEYNPSLNLNLTCPQDRRGLQTLNARH